MCKLQSLWVRSLVRRWAMVLHLLTFRETCKTGSLATRDIDIDIDSSATRNVDTHWHNNRFHSVPCILFGLHFQLCSLYLLPEYGEWFLQCLSCLILVKHTQTHTLLIEIVYDSGLAKEGLEALFISLFWLVRCTLGVITWYTYRWIVIQYVTSLTKFFYVLSGGNLFAPQYWGSGPPKLEIVLRTSRRLPEPLPHFGSVFSSGASPFDCKRQFVTLWSRTFIKTALAS
jgi:hypothetical protein